MWYDGSVSMYRFLSMMNRCFARAYLNYSLQFAYKEFVQGGIKMLKKISSLPFQGTPEQEAQLKEVIQKHKDDPGAVMPVLQEAQDIYGYLPLEVQQMIAEGLNVPVDEVYGVATFYSQFALSPKGKYNISVCLGTACYVKGSGDVLNRLSSELGIEAEECTMDGMFSLTACRCIGACGLAPVMTVNDDVYGRLVADDVPSILAKYKEA